MGVKASYGLRLSQLRNGVACAPWNVHSITLLVVQLSSLWILPLSSILLPCNLFHSHLAIFPFFTRAVHKYSTLAILQFLLLVQFHYIPPLQCFHSEGIEWFIENQAFSPSYDLAPPPSRPSFVSLPVCRRKSLLTGEEGGGAWGGAKSYDC